MKSQSNFSLNWSGNIKVSPKIIYPNNLEELKKIIREKNFIIAGNQRSFGDNSINDSLIISMRNFKQILNFDKSKGIIETQSGVLLKDVLGLIIEAGWCVPVTPGSKYVSMGGMIANNVHGKNIINNQIKHYILELKILTEKNEIITCSQTENKNYFESTIGGFGLTGCILSSKIRLKKINSILIDQEILEFTSYNNFFSLLEKSNLYEYNVNWVESFGNGRIKGLCYFGRHKKNTKPKSIGKFSFKEKKIDFFNYLILKIFTQNYYLIKLTKFVFRKLKKIFYKKTATFDEFFYPQDYFINWNKIYGKNGFFQAQFLVKENNLKDIMNKISKFFKKEKNFSTFIIIKKFDEKGKYLNFYGQGFSISMDIPINSKFEITKNFLNSLFKEHDIKVNFSKDSIVNKNLVKNQKDYSEFVRELNLISPERKFNSIFSKRLDI